MPDLPLMLLRALYILKCGPGIILLLSTTSIYIHINICIQTIDAFSNMMNSHCSTTILTNVKKDANFPRRKKVNKEKKNTSTISIKYNDTKSIIFYGYTRNCVDFT